MQTHQWAWKDGAWDIDPAASTGVHLVLVFGAREVLEEEGPLVDLRKAHPEALIAGCSTAGHIRGVHVYDEGLIATGITFEDTPVKGACRRLQGRTPDEVGALLAEDLPHEGLRHVLLFSHGLEINGSALVEGLVRGLPPGVQVTGGLAGDQDRFEATRVVTSEGALDEAVVAVGLYGDRIRVGYGSLGGWDPFGPMRRVTRSEGNVLYELDGKPALPLYKRYLGDHADELPASGLLFPLALQGKGGSERVRTILGVDEKTDSLTFAGDVPEGSVARLMKANFDRLVGGAEGAATDSTEALGEPADLALLISCVGRRLVLKQRVEEELDAVRSVIGPQAALAGFYSYGEICPSAPDVNCELHNQTMTITTLREM